MEGILKPIWWIGQSKDELMAFPKNAIQDAGYQLHRLQEGNEPQDWRPLTGLGKGISGVYEIRIRDDNAIFRVAYVTKFSGYITVLHCWQKTSQATAMPNKAMIIKRYLYAKESLK